MGIYDQIKRQFVLPDAYEAWRTYREQITQIIVSDASFPKSTKTIAILGAGACNDIELTVLAQYFKEIILIDVDIAPMRQAFDHVPDSVRDKITVREGSLTGIGDEDQRRFCEHILHEVGVYGNSLTGEIYNAILMEELEKLNAKRYLKEQALLELLPIAGYDFVVCLGVHSQLFSILSYMIRVLSYNVSEQLFQGMIPHDGDVVSAIKDMSSRSIPLLNNAILKCARDKVVIGCEYDEKNPVEGAYQCIMDIRKRGMTVEEQHLLWDFNPGQNVRYDMLIQTLDRVPE